MPKVGIRELKNDTSEIIRAVREEQAAYVVTYRGQPVAVILPVAEALRQRSAAQILAESQEHEAYWAHLDTLATEIEAAWQGEMPAVDTLIDQRRDL